MKKVYIIVLVFLMFVDLIAEAQTVKVKETKASVNGEMEVTITADANISQYIALGFFLELPEGFSVTEVEGVKGDDVQSDHVVRVGQTGNSKLRVAIYSLANSAFELYSIPPIAGPGQSGEGGGGGRTARQKAPSEEEKDIPLTLCTLKLQAPNKKGSFKGELSKIEFATNNHSLITSDAVSFNISINGKGDVNNDGEVNTKDIVDLVSYMMGNTTLSLSAADVNGDGKVDIADVIMVSKTILSK